MSTNLTGCIQRMASDRATIRVSQFQPFSSRRGIDEVVGLAFDYDAHLVAKLKALFALYGADHKYRTVGGWLAKHRCWFAEADVWELIKLELLYLGYRIEEGDPR